MPSSPAVTGQGCESGSQLSSLTPDEALGPLLPVHSPAHLQKGSPPLLRSVVTRTTDNAGKLPVRGDI